MQAALISLVWRRARHYCEHCQMPQEFDPTPFEIDHIVSEKHKGPTVAGNLCLSCFYCNSFKESDISSLDAVTRELTPLFNPRRHKWSRHFVWEGPYLVGQPAIGRVTIELLRINDPFRVDFREDLMAEGLFPPE